MYFKITSVRKHLNALTKANLKQLQIFYPNHALKHFKCYYSSKVVVSLYNICDFKYFLKYYINCTCLRNCVNSTLELGNP